MEQDMDAFLEQVRSSEKLLQELQSHLQQVMEETDKSQSSVAKLCVEQRAVADDGLRAEQQLADANSLTLVQDIRLNKIYDYRERIRRDLGLAQMELSETRGQLDEERTALCSGVSKHLSTFGLGGDYLSELNRVKLSEVSQTKALAQQVESQIGDLRKHESVLELELMRLADVEREIQAVKQRASEPLHNRNRLYDVQQRLITLEHNLRDGKHLLPLHRQIGDADDETTCLRSAAAAMTSELQKLEQLLWFSRMEKMKQNMRARSRYTAEHQPKDGSDVNNRDHDVSPSSAVPCKARRTADAWIETVNLLKTDDNGIPPRGRPEAATADLSDSLECGQDGSAVPGDDVMKRQDVERGARVSAPPAADGADLGSTCPPADRGGPTADTGRRQAQLAQRRWQAHQARMMACRQPPPPPPPPLPPHAPTPPQASVRPLPRATPAAVRPVRGWGQAAASPAGGRLSYRGPQLARPHPRTDHFASAPEQADADGTATAKVLTASGPAYKRVRFSTEDRPPNQSSQSADRDMEDFV